MKKTLAALIAALALTSACKKDEAAKPADPSAPEAAKPAEPAKPAENAAAPAAAQGAAQGDVSKVQGTWNLEPDDVEVKRTIELTRVALKSPKPDAKELAALKLTADEKAMVDDIMAGGEGASEAKKMLQEFDSATITITGDKVVMALDEAPEEAPYTVKSAEGNTVILHVKPPKDPEEDITFKVVDANTLEMYAEGDPEKVILRRKK